MAQNTLKQQYGGGGCPRTPNHNFENLQFESVAEVSCLFQGKKCPFEGLQNSSAGMDAYKLKVEKSENRRSRTAWGGQSPAFQISSYTAS